LGFHGDFWRQKTRVPGHGVISVILGLAIFVVGTTLTCDRGMDGQTHRHTMTANTMLT